ncbi:unnamed protein product [Clonostachys byssicola]|uniref:Uncharacterized protein n=1 Tax=Clonostachys byssicola TaxID=160290 RepID=A0A9N9UAL8_9HYPO|nr:unnamed protein product [Clonostachys byssicola]
MLSIMILVALVVLLYKFDGKPAPSWRFGLTLNTIVAFLSTICWATMMVPVTEALSQLKWNWMSLHVRPLRDLYLFDQASRWPFWSVRLLLRLRGRFIPLASAASVVLVVSLVTSSVTQSAIEYRLEDVPISPGGNASIGAFAPISTEYPGRINGNESQEDCKSIRLIGLPSKVREKLSYAAFQGFLQPIDEPWPEPELKCGSTNCSWPQFNSLGVCYSILNITHKLNSTRTDFIRPTFPASLPYALLPDPINKVRNGTDALISERSESPDAGSYRAVIPKSGTIDPFALPAMLSSNRKNYKVMNITVDRGDFSNWHKDHKQPYWLSTYGNWGNDDVLSAALSQFHLLYSNPMAQSPNCSRAFEIFLHFCVKTYNVTTENSRGKATMVSSTTKLAKVNYGGYTSDGRSASYSLAAEEGPHTLFNITSVPALRYLEGMILEISGSSVISGNTTVDDRHGSIPAGKEYATTDGTLDTEQGSPSMLAKQLFSKLYGDTWVSNSSADESKYETSEEYIDKATERNIHKLFGNVASAMTSYLRTRNEPVALEGSKTYERVNMIVIRWEWLSFLVVQIALALVFQVVVFVQTARLGVDVVKSSNMAELFALQGSGDKYMDNSLSGGIGTAVTDERYGKLVKDTHGWKLHLSTRTKLSNGFMT